MKDEANKWNMGDFIGELGEVRSILEGGMGIVYVCYDPETKANFALKTFKDRYLSEEKAKKDFIREAEIWIRLDYHENIVKAYFVRNLLGKPYIGMEYVPPFKGKNTLRQCLRGRLDLGTTITFGIELCNGMIHATRKVPDLVHCDIKPENIMIRTDGPYEIAKVTDFGIAGTFSSNRRISDNNDSYASFVVSGEKGSFKYMAPEQFPEWLLNYFGYALHPISTQTDIYSFGLVLYEMATGKHIFQTCARPTKDIAILREANDIVAKTCYDLEHQRFAEWCTYFFLKFGEVEPSKIYTHYSDLDEIIAKCLQKNPKERYCDFRKVREELIRLAQERREANKILLGELIEQCHRLGIPITQIPPRTYKRMPSNFRVMDLANKGISMFELGRADEAIALLKKAIEQNPNFVMAHYNLGSIYESKGMYEEATIMFKKATELDPQFPKAYTRLGFIYYQKGWFDKAVTELNHAIELDSRDELAKQTCYKAHECLAAFATERGLLRQAIVEHKRAIELDGNDAVAHWGLGAAYNDSGLFDEAIDELEKAANLEPRIADVHYQLGILYYRVKGSLNDAMIEFGRALEIDPRHALAHLELGTCFCHEGLFEKAIVELEKSAELNPKLAKAHLNLGVIREKIGQHDQAITEFKKVVNIDPHDATAHYYIALSHFLSNSFSLSLKYALLAKEFGMADDKLDQLIDDLNRIIKMMKSVDLNEKSEVESKDRS